MRTVVWWLMDHACADWNHHAFFCWNEPRLVNRLWIWAISGVAEESASVVEADPYPSDLAQRTGKP